MLAQPQPTCVPPSSDGWVLARDGSIHPPPSLSRGCASCAPALGASSWRPAGGLSMRGYHVWGASVVRSAEDGQYHMLASRWPSPLSHLAWVIASEVVHATAPRPAGPYTFRGVALPRRGKNFWDGMATHNPHVRYDASRCRYVLWYIGITYAFAPPTCVRSGGGEGGSGPGRSADRRHGRELRGSSSDDWTRGACAGAPFTNRTLYAAVRCATLPSPDTPPPQVAHSLNLSARQQFRHHFPRHGGRSGSASPPRRLLGGRGRDLTRQCSSRDRASGTRPSPPTRPLCCIPTVAPCSSSRVRPQVESSGLAPPKRPLPRDHTAGCTEGGHSSHSARREGSGAAGRIRRRG